MPVQSDNPPQIITLDQWKGMNQQGRRGAIDDQETWWNENLYPIGPGNLRSCWGPSAPLYTAPAGTTILRLFFGYIGTGSATEGQPPPAQAFQGPPPGRLGFMCLSDGNIDQVDLDTLEVTRIGQVWQPVAPNYWCSIKVWRPQWIGGTNAGQQGGVVIGSPKGLYAWDGATLSSPGDPSPEWLSNETPGVDPISPMPVGLPGIYCMEVWQNRLWVAGKDVISFSAPSNGANFSTAMGGGSFGYYGDLLTYAYMDLAGSAGYLYCFGDSSTDLISNVQFSGSGTTSDPFLTNFLYANIDPQVGQRFPRPVGRWGRYFTMWNGAGIFLMFGGDAQMIGQKTTNVYLTLDTSQFLPTMAPVTFFGFRHMLCNGRFTDPFGVTRSLLLAWNGEAWTPMSQNLNLTEIGSYEDNSVITAYGTNGNSLYRLFDHPDPALPKVLSTKATRAGEGNTQLTIKNWKRAFAEIHDNDGRGVSFTGTITSGGGGIPGGAQDIAFDLPAGARFDILPASINSQGVWAGLDLRSVSPDFVLERIHLAVEERTLYGA